MKKCDCDLCKFENPKLTSTAVIIRDQKFLVAKRNQEPFKGEWDFIGGYIQKNESSEEGLKRELKEELGVDCELTFLRSFTGTDTYNNFQYPVLTFVYLTEIKGEIKLDTTENSEVEWIPISELDKVAFDSGMEILKFVKEKFTFDLEKVRKLVG